MCTCTVGGAASDVGSWTLFQNVCSLGKGRLIGRSAEVKEKTSELICQTFLSPSKNAVDSCRMHHALHVRFLASLHVPISDPGVTCN